jgi:hypothetical protein
MNPIEDQGQNNKARSSTILLALSSLTLGGGAIWWAWLRYEDLARQSDSYWYSWVQLAGMALVGILCLLAAMLFFQGRQSARSVFKLGISIVPIILFANLMILVFHGIQNVLQGDASFFLDRILAQPYKLLFILVIVIALAVLGSLNEKEKQQP